MKKISNKITPRDFAPYYPYGIHPCPMYVAVANRVYNTLKTVNIDLPHPDNLKKELAINIAIYYEDKMSGVGLWNAFMEKHRELYGRQLPFFDDFDVLAMDDVNSKEVELLIWLVISREFDDRFLNPLVMGENAAGLIMEVLTEDDEVEINDDLYDFIYNDNTANDYFRLKHVLMWLRRSYLLQSPLSNEKFTEFERAFSKMPFGSEARYYAETMFIMTTEIGPLALEPHVCLADMYKLNGMQKESLKLMELQYRKLCAFAVTDSKKGYAVLKDPLGECFRVRNDYDDVMHPGAYVFTSLVNYAHDYWEINGMVMQSDKTAYDNSCEHEKSLKLSYEKVYPMYMDKTGGRRMSFFEDIEQTACWLKKIAPDVDVRKVKRELPYKSCVAFISKKAGIIFAPGIVHAIKSKDNPYYGKCDASAMQEETMAIVADSKSVHPEMLQYLLENDMLRNGDLSHHHPTSLGNAIFTRNIDFIARNHRRHLYHDHDY